VFSAEETTTLQRLTGDRAQDSQPTVVWSKEWVVAKGLVGDLEMRLWWHVRAGTKSLVCFVAEQ
jgi:hypothetical protein